MTKNINYCKGNDQNSIVERYIYDRPNSSSNTPMYSITLTPADISDIRDYNEDHAYNNFEMTMDNISGHYVSNFISDLITNGKMSVHDNCIDRIDGKWCSNMEVTE